MPRTPAQSDPHLLQPAAQLQQQNSLAAFQAAKLAAGPPVTYEPGWKAWPVHAWPFSASKSAKQAQAHAEEVTAQNNKQIVSLQAKQAALGC